MSATFQTLAYEDVRVMRPLVAALHAICEPGEFVIFRQPFRWLRHDGDHANDSVMPNCYEMFELESVLAQANLTCRYSFEHAAICRQIARAYKPATERAA